jgi:hypothetical protein
MYFLLVASVDDSWSMVMTDKLLTETTYYRTERWIINILSAIVWHVVTFPRRFVRLVRLLRMRVPREIIKTELRLMVGKRTHPGPVRGTPITEDNLRSFGFTERKMSGGSSVWWKPLRVTIPGSDNIPVSDPEHYSVGVFFEKHQDECYRVSVHVGLCNSFYYVVKRMNVVEDIDLLVDLLHEQSLEERSN